MAAQSKLHERIMDALRATRAHWRSNWEPVGTQWERNKRTRSLLWANELPDVIDFTNFRLCHKSADRSRGDTHLQYVFTAILCVRSWSSMCSQCALCAFSASKLRPLVCFFKRCHGACILRPYTALIRAPRFGAQVSSWRSSLQFYNRHQIILRDHTALESVTLKLSYVSGRSGRASVIVGRCDRAFRLDESVSRN